jgi:hypothetical protein
MATTIEQPWYQWLRTLFFIAVVAAVGGLAFALGLSWSAGHADAAPQASKSGGPKIVYPKKTELDFEGMPLQGELRSPGEFYFQHKPEEKFDSLVKRRKNFHKEMLRDAVLSK